MFKKVYMNSMFKCLRKITRNTKRYGITEGTILNMLLAQHYLEGVEDKTESQKKDLSLFSKFVEENIDKVTDYKKKFNLTDRVQLVLKRAVPIACIHFLRLTLIGQGIILPFYVNALLLGILAYLYITALLGVLFTLVPDVVDLPLQLPCMDKGVKIKSMNMLGLCNKDYYIEKAESLGDDDLLSALRDSGKTDLVRYLAYIKLSEMED